MNIEEFRGELLRRADQYSKERSAAALAYATYGWQKDFYRVMVVEACCMELTRTVELLDRMNNNNEEK